MDPNQELEDSDEEWEEVSTQLDANSNQSNTSNERASDYRTDSDLFIVPKGFKVKKNIEKGAEELKSGTLRKGLTKTERLQREVLHKVHLIIIIIAVNLRVKWIEVLSKWIGRKNPFPPEFNVEVSEFAISKSKKSLLFINLLRKLVRWWKQEVRTSKKIGCSLRTTGPGFIANEFIEYINSAEDITRHISTECSTIVFASLLKHLGLRLRLVAALYPVPLSLSKAAEASERDIRSSFIPSKRPRSSSSKSSSKSVKRMKDAVQREEVYKKKDLEFIESYNLDYPISTEKYQEIDDLALPSYFEELLPVYPFYIWCEIFDHDSNAWIPVDPVQGYVKEHRLFEPPPSAKRQLQFSYIIACEPPFPYSDITSDYTTKWGSLTSRIRLKVNDDNDWWCNTLKSFNDYIDAILDTPYTKESPVNKNNIYMAQMKEVMPTNLSGFRNHPLYALECQLKKNEIIHPIGPQHSVGLFRKSYVYPRSSVHKLSTKMGWLKQGRFVLPGSTPIKVLPRRNTKASKKLVMHIEKSPYNKVDKSESDQLFASFQTKEYLADLIINENIPRNSFGNFDLFHENMLPSNAVHIKDPGVEKIARELGISYAPALVGFEHSASGATPLIKGIIVPIERSAELNEHYFKSKQETLDLAEKKRKERIRYLWKKAISYALNKVRLYKKYGSNYLEDVRTFYSHHNSQPHIEVKLDNKSSVSQHSDTELSKMWDSAE